MSVRLGDEIYLPDFGWCEITNLFDDDGDEIDGEDEPRAVTAVGKRADGGWVAIRLSGIEPQKKN